MDVSIKEQCDCGWNRTESLPFLNYLMPIPIEKVFKLTSDSNLIEMNKTHKFKAINFCSNYNDMRNAVNNSLERLTGKLFFYFSNLIKGNSKASLCRKCNDNYINRSLLLNNLPACLSFSLSSQNLFAFDLNELLLSYVLIPNILELGQLFNNSSNQKIFYDFCGVVMLSKAMTYAVAVKQPDTTWKYFYQDRAVYCQNRFELISLCLRDMCMPILLTFQIQEKYSNNEKDLDAEDIRALEKYVCSIEAIRLDNPFRVKEGILQLEPQRMNSKKQIEINCNNDNGTCANKNHSSKTSTCNSTTSKNSSEMNRYSCLHCRLMNRIENVQCLSCKKNNIDIINRIKSSKQDDSFTNHNQEKLFKQMYFNSPYGKQAHLQQKNNQSIGSQLNPQALKAKEPLSFNRKQYSAKQSNSVVINPHSHNSNNKSPSVISRDLSRDNPNSSKPREKDKSKEHKLFKKEIASEKWRCDICENYNQPHVYRCFSCQTMNTFQRDLLQGLKVHKEKPINLQSKHKQPSPSSKASKSQLYTQTEGSSNAKQNTRQLSLQNINPDCNPNNSIKGIKAATSRMLCSPSKKSQIGAYGHFNTNPNVSSGTPLSRPKTSLRKNRENPFT